MKSPHHSISHPKGAGHWALFQGSRGTWRQLTQSSPGSLSGRTGHSPPQCNRKTLAYPIPPCSGCGSGFAHRRRSPGEAIANGWLSTHLLSHHCCLTLEADVTVFLPSASLQVMLHHPGCTPSALSSPLIIFLTHLRVPFLGLQISSGFPITQLLTVDVKALRALALFFQFQSLHMFLKARHGAGY